MSKDTADGKRPTKPRKTHLTVASNDGDAAHTWRQSLKYSDEGRLTRDAGNAALWLVNDEHWRGLIAYDEFSGRIAWRGDAPELIGLPAPKCGAPLDRQGVTFVQHWLRKNAGPSFGREAVEEAIQVAAFSNRFHPVRDFIRSVPWDGTARVATWLPRYIGTVDDRYHREVGRMWLVSAVARVMAPGCQADYMLVLEGDQGMQKSSALRALFGDWTLEGIPDIRDQVRTASAIQGRWAIEIAELHQFRGVAIQLVKGFITTCFDRFRGAYQKFERDAPRQCIFAGTTNEDQYLIDPTGARRFWPVKCGKIDIAGLLDDRAQVWAEALQIYMGGEAVGWDPRQRDTWSWWPDSADKELCDALREAQEDRHELDAWETKILEWLDQTKLDQVTTGKVLGDCFSLKPSEWDRSLQTRIGGALRRLGWRVGRRRDGASRERVYTRPGLLIT